MGAIVYGGLPSLVKKLYIREGNSFQVLLVIYRNNIQEDLTGATITVLNLVGPAGTTAILNKVISGNLIRVPITPAIASALGSYSFELKYTIPDAEFASGVRECALDAYSFDIVPTSAQASDIDEFAIPADVATGFRGAAFTFEMFTPEQIEILQKPAKDIAGTIALNEVVRIHAEEARVTAEQQREIAEGERNLAETARESAETNRNTEEGKRATAESSRATEEGKRVTAETARVTAEGDATKGRVKAENDRVTAENTRQTKETERQQAETARVNAEGDATKGRVKAEADRVAAEALRVTAEAGRAAELAAKAAHGYTAPAVPKTLKQVDDSLVQLAGDVNGIIGTDREYAQKAINGYYLVTNQGIGNAIASSPTPEITYQYLKIAVKKNQAFYVRANGGASPKAWCFVDESNAIISFTPTINYNGLVFAPSDGYLVVNNIINATILSVELKENFYSPKINHDYSILTTKGSFITTNQGVGQKIATSPTVNALYEYVKLPVKAGETYYVNAAGGSSPRAWSTTDINDTILSVDETVNGLNYNRRVDILADGYLVVNNIIDKIKLSIKGIPIVKQITTSRHIYIAASDSSGVDKAVADFVCTGVNDEAVINTAIRLLPKGGTIQLLDGNYNIDAFPYTVGAGIKAAIYFPYTQYGAVTTLKGTTENHGYLSHHGVILHVTETAYNTCDAITTYSVICGDPTRPTTDGNDEGIGGWIGTFTFTNNVNIENLYIYLFSNKKKFIGIDGRNFGSMGINLVGVYHKDFFRARFDWGKQVPPIPLESAVEGCIGVWSNRASNDEMARIEMNFVNVGGLFEGFVLNGVDHLVMRSCFAVMNCWGYTFLGNAFKTLTMLNCSDEGNRHLPRFTGSGHLSNIDFNIEGIKDATPLYPDYDSLPYYATEDPLGTDGWNGYISFTGGKFFNAGSGHNFIVVNQTHKRYTTTPAILCDFGEEFYHTGLNKKLFYSGTNWIDAMGNVII